MMQLMFTLLAVELAAAAGCQWLAHPAQDKSGKNCLHRCMDAQSDVADPSASPSLCFVAHTYMSLVCLTINVRSPTEQCCP